jgi:2'-5' RNA ligase
MGIRAVKVGCGRFHAYALSRVQGPRVQGLTSKAYGLNSLGSNVFFTFNLEFLTLNFELLWSDHCMYFMNVWQGKKGQKLNACGTRNGSLTKECTCATYFFFVCAEEIVETLRTFVALILPEDARRVLEREQQDLAGRISGVKWAGPRTIHVTLVFLGPTPAAVIAEIGTAVREAAARCKPIQFTLQGIGAFPHSRSPKVVWAGMHNCDALFELQHQLADALEAFGFQKDKKPFKAHITLGRVRDGSARSALGAILEERRNHHFGEFQAGQLAFVHSDLRPSGPVYTLLEECKLHHHR